MKIFTLLLIVFSFSCTAQHCQVESKSCVSVYPKKLDGDNHIKLFAKNLTKAHVTMRVDLSFTNYNSTRPGDFEILLPPDTKEMELVELKKKGSGAYRWRYNYRYVGGRVEGIHDNSYVYNFPFAKGRSYKIIQGYNGTFTHKNRLAHAIDLDLKIGDPIHAAREGVVIKVEEHNTAQGVTEAYAKLGNRIVIEHTDFTYASYVHLKKDGGLVNPGDYVVKGQLLGYSGFTGRTKSPHLHFQVYKINKSDLKYDTIPITFGWDGVYRKSTFKTGEVLSH
jgi:murein DD-endopeptidase MepM/ murein hydrolase activator NlpD